MNDLAKALAVAAEITGTRLSEPAAAAFLLELQQYPTHRVLHALHRCMRELRGRLTLADVLDRLYDYPTPDEAWASCPRSEAETVVWTQEAAQAFGVASTLAAVGDTVAARRAFIDAYTNLVREARNRRQGPKYSVSMGYDKNGRREVISRAIAEGKLPRSIAASFPDLIEEPAPLPAAIGPSETRSGLAAIAASMPDFDFGDDL